MITAESIKETEIELRSDIFITPRPQREAVQVLNVENSRINMHIILYINTIISSTFFRLEFPQNYPEAEIKASQSCGGSGAPEKTFKYSYK